MEFGDVNSEPYGNPSTKTNMDLSDLLAKKPRMLVAIALANKMARGLWAMITANSDFKNPATAAAQALTASDKRGREEVTNSKGDRSARSGADKAG